MFHGTQIQAALRQSQAAPVYAPHIRPNNISLSSTCLSWRICFETHAPLYNLKVNRFAEQTMAWIRRLV